MDYVPILKEIESKVRLQRPCDRVDHVEAVLYHTFHARFTEEECYPLEGKNPVSLFTQVLSQKYPSEYKNKLLQWIHHVVGAWTHPTPSDLRSQLECWVKRKIEVYRESMGLDEPESEDEYEDHAEYTRLGDIPLRHRR
jgi:hypothetical protein